MDPTTLNVLLGIAIVLGIISIVLIIFSLRPQPKAETIAMWPPKFFFPLASDASLLTPRATQTGTNAMVTLEMKIQPNATPLDDEEPTARQLDLNKISELADKTNTKKPMNATMPAMDLGEATNKNVIGNPSKPLTNDDADATSKQVLK
jgi:hypothetical protein